MARLTEYTDDQAAHALAMLKANGGNAKRTAALLGIPRTTLRQWAGRAQSMNALPKQVSEERVQDQTRELAQRLERVALLSVDEGIDEAIAKASAKDRMIVAGIAIEKRQLLIGSPTSRNASVVIHLVGGGSLKELAEVTLNRTTPALEASNEPEDVAS